MINRSTLQFLSALKKNNQKEWFDKNRESYTAAKENVVRLIEYIIKVHGKKDPTISQITAKNCFFRINRDVRFSKDKSPYKTNIGAYINPGGKKMMTAGYYLHIEPGGSFAGGGVYMPPPDLLRKIRQEIDYNTDQWKKIISSRSFKSVYGTLNINKETSLSRPPKGYEATHPAAQFLMLKSYVATIQLSDKELLSADLPKRLLSAFSALQPLIHFLNEALNSE
jgi:uncharacterized protein (TIGR02453 family)